MCAAREVRARGTVDEAQGSDLEDKRTGTEEEFLGIWLGTEPGEGAGMPRVNADG